MAMEARKNPIDNLPPMTFWSAFVKNGKRPTIYVGMTEARSSSQAKIRILKEWKDQSHVVDDIQKGKLTLLVRRLAIKKGR